MIVIGGEVMCCCTFISVIPLRDGIICWKASKEIYSIENIKASTTIGILRIYTKK